MLLGFPNRVRQLPGRMKQAFHLFTACVCCGAMLVEVASAQAKSSSRTGAEQSGLSEYQRGLAAYSRGNLATARAAFDTAVHANPKDADAENMLAQVLLRLGEVDHA